MEEYVVRSVLPRSRRFLSEKQGTPSPCATEQGQRHGITPRNQKRLPAHLFFLDPKFRRGFEAEAQKLAMGEQLTRLRRQAGLTQAQVAKRTRTTASAISCYENVEYDRYELRTLQRIVRACGGRLDIILESGPKTNHAA